MICVALIRFVVFPQKTSTSAYPRDPDPVGASEGFLRLVNLLVQQMLDKSWMLDLLIGMVSFNVFLRCFFFVFNMWGGFTMQKCKTPLWGLHFVPHERSIEWHQVLLHPFHASPWTVDLVFTQFTRKINGIPSWNLQQMFHGVASVEKWSSFTNVESNCGKTRALVSKFPWKWRFWSKSREGLVQMTFLKQNRCF